MLKGEENFFKYAAVIIKFVSVHYTAFEWACQMYCEGYCYSQ